jgi:hypothetical protein
VSLAKGLCDVVTGIHIVAALYCLLFEDFIENVPDFGSTSL